MELKEYIAIFKKHVKFFYAIVGVVVAVVFVFFFSKPVSYDVLLTLNITRSGFQQTTEYKYDDFYRLQADEKFAETVVEWLKNAKIVADVYSKAGVDYSDMTLRSLSKSFRAEKFSSQLIAVSFAAGNIDSAKKIAKSVVEVVDENTKDLNKNQKENSWFEVASKDPIIVKDSINFLMVFLGSLAAGIFIAFWAVMVKHYLE